MNWNRLILISSITFALVAIPVPTAQPAPSGVAMPRGGMPHAGFSGGARTFPSRGGGANSRGGTGGGHHWGQGGGHGGGHWGHHGGHHHHYFYPYYGYYPYGYFGYPYWGTSFYYGAYEPYYYGVRGSGSIIVDVQHELARAGYYHGAIDGVIGRGTRRAIRLYERANGLPVDGLIDQDLLATMGFG